MAQWTRAPEGGSGARTTDAAARRAIEPGKRTRVEDVAAIAARGVAAPACALPYADAIQRAFGRHDISAVQAHVGPEADAAAGALGGAAYAHGEHVVLGPGADLFTVAHEAAHVVQQRAGLAVSGEVGAAGDAHEQHADAVAARVVEGESAEALLDRVVGSGSPRSAVQLYRPITRRELDVDDAAPATFPAQDRAPTARLERPERPAPGLWSRLFSWLPGVHAAPAPSEPEGEVALGHRARERGLDDPALALNLSDDGQMLIEDTEDEPRAFYATREVVADSNARLEATESAVRLHETAGAVHAGDHKLVRVEPGVAPVGDAERASVLDLRTSICNEVAAQVMGARDLRATLVLQAPGAPRAERQAMGPTPPSDAPDAVRGLAGAGAARAGLDEHALPEVGEGFATFSMPATGDDAAGPSGGAPRWPYHFAGVVARSGGDRVTLENYNRSSQVGDALVELARRERGRLADALADTDELADHLRGARR